MVLDFYNLREQPFGPTPDPRYLFASATHREALASLLYGIKARRGFIALIATPGMGKTTLLFRSLNQLKGAAKTVFLFQTIATPIDFMRTLLRDLGVDDLQGGLDALQAKLTDILAEHSQRGEQLIVVIDEAQNLDDSVLELVRMLSNFETAKEKLMQIILSGQPQLAIRLASPELVQLRQRVSIIAQLKPLSVEETTLYVNHRLRIAGYSRQRPLFNSAALRLIADYSQGIPRNINNLCFNSLSIGTALKKPVIDSDVVREVITDLDLDPLMDRLPPRAKATTSVLEETSRPMVRIWTAGLVVALLAVLAFVAISPLKARFTKTEQSVVTATGPDSLEVMPQILSPEDGAIPSDPLFIPEVPVLSTALPSEKVSRAPTQGRQLERSAIGSAIYSNEILVKPGMDFYSICVQVFSTCNTSDVEVLHRLNPWLSDSNHVTVGEVLIIPPRTNVSEAATPAMTHP